MKYIGRKMIEDGLMSKVIIPSIEDQYLVVTIGEHYFYSNILDDEYDNADDIPFGVLVTEIKDALDDFYGCPDVFEDEYLYYYYYLCENI